MLDEWADLDAIERDLGLSAGQPFVLRPDGAPDPDVTSYFASRSFRRLAKDTQRSYASDLKVFLSFRERHGTDWRNASHAAHSGWWDHIAPFLSRTHRVIAPDLSGHGDSDCRDAYDLDIWAQELLAVPAAAGHSDPRSSVTAWADG